MVTFKPLRMARLARRCRYLFRSRLKCREHGTIYESSCADCRRARWRRRSRERCNIHRLRWEPSCKHCRRALTNRRVRLGRKITRGVALQFGKEIFKGIGHGIAAIILIAWLLADNAESLHWQILVAAIAAAILFDPVVTGTKLVKKLVRTVLYSTDDTDALWEADWLNIARASTTPNAISTGETLAWGYYRGCLRDGLVDSLVCCRHITRRADCQ